MPLDIYHHHIPFLTLAVAPFRAEADGVRRPQPDAEGDGRGLLRQWVAALGQGNDGVGGEVNPKKLRWENVETGCGE